MATYALDTKNTDYRATGVVNPVMEWTEGADGRNRPSDVQATDDNGVPLWQVEMWRKGESFGAESSSVETVLVPHPQEPQVKEFGPLEVHGLTVEVFIQGNRAAKDGLYTKGTLVERFRAAGMGSAPSGGSSHAQASAESSKSN